MKINIVETLRKYRRVLQVAKKPSIEDLRDTARICGLGFLIIGIIGFVFYIISVLGGV